LRELAGVEVTDYYALDEDVPIKGNWFEGVSRKWAEGLRVLEDKSTVVIARYGACNGWLDEQPAMTVRGVRTGLVYYVGCCLDDEAQQAFITRFAQNSSVREQFLTPPGVQILHRISKDNINYHILINHTRAQQTVDLPWPATDHLADAVHEGKLPLPAYGVVILTRRVPSA
jgi:beta-galactosidase